MGGGGSSLPEQMQMGGYSGATEDGRIKLFRYKRILFVVSLQGLLFFDFTTVIPFLDSSEKIAEAI